MELEFMCPVPVPRALKKALGTLTGNSVSKKSKSKKARFVTVANEL